MSIAVKTSTQIEPAISRLLDGGPSFIATDHPATVTGFVDYDVDNSVVITTSGSTGSAKAVVLSAEAIKAAAHNFRRRYGAFTWTCALPVHHVAGLMVLARGWLDRDYGGRGVRYASPKLDDLQIEGTEPQALSIVPTQLVRLAQQGQLSLLQGFDLVLVGGASMPSDVMAQAAAVGINVVTSYGMSETCGGAVFDSVALPGVKLRVDSDQRIWIAGDMLFSGYLGAPELTATTLVDGWLKTNDRGEIRDRRLRVIGRMDDVIISGGLNIDLADVQRTIDRVAAGAVVVGVPDPEWGTRVVLATTTDADLRSWRELLRPHLPAHALPRQVLCLGDMPLTAAGKIDRQRIIRLAAANQ